MRLYRVVTAAAMLAVAVAGCAGPGDRETVLNRLNPEPMSEGSWAHYKGTYLGAVRSTTQRWGYEGVNSTNLRLDLSGPVTAPGVIMRTETGYSTAWMEYGERKGTFTNIPEKRYGSQGWVDATTHYPNQVLLHYRRFGGALAPAGAWMVLTFRNNGTAGVDFIGHSGYRGDGDLYRAPDLARLN